LTLICGLITQNILICSNVKLCDRQRTGGSPLMIEWQSPSVSDVEKDHTVVLWMVTCGE